MAELEHLGDDTLPGKRRVSVNLYAEHVLHPFVAAP